jgi:hypothetical protein
MHMPHPQQFVDLAVIGKIAAAHAELLKIHSAVARLVDRNFGVSGDALDHPSVSGFDVHLLQGR